MPFNLTEYCFPIWLLFVVAIVVVGVYSSWSSRKRLGVTFKETAQAIGLQYAAGGWIESPSASGQYRGKKVILDTFQKGSGKHRQVFTRFQVFHKASISGDIVLEPENAITWIGKKLGAEDVHVGNKAFDDQYMVVSSDQAEAKSLLDLDMQQKIMEMRISLRVTPNYVGHEEGGYLYDKERIIKLTNLLVDLAERLERR
jgi:hypothetical protein